MTSVPTIEVKGPAGKIVINAADLDKYRAKGYRPVEETGQETEAGAKARDETNGEHSENELQQEFKTLDQLTVPELKTMAGQVGIVEVDGKPVAQMKKAELVDAIQAKQADGAF
jgi:hypothetical protein